MNAAELVKNLLYSNTSVNTTKKIINAADIARGSKKCKPKNGTDFYYLIRRDQVIWV